MKKVKFLDNQKAYSRQFSQKSQFMMQTCVFSFALLIPHLQNTLWWFPLMRLFKDMEQQTEEFVSLSPNW